MERYNRYTKYYLSDLDQRTLSEADPATFERYQFLHFSILDLNIESEQLTELERLVSKIKRQKYAVRKAAAKAERDAFVGPHRPFFEWYRKGR